MINKGPINTQVINGTGLTAGAVFITAACFAEAGGTADAVKLIKPVVDTQCVANTTGNNDRTAFIESSTSCESYILSSPVRFARTASVSEEKAALSGELVRYAKASAHGVAETYLYDTSVNIVSVSGFAEPTAETVSNPLRYGFAGAVSNTTALSVNKSSLTEKWKVNFRYSEAYTISRGHARGTANSWMGSGVSICTGFTEGQLRLTQNCKGSSVSESVITSNMNRIRFVKRGFNGFAYSQGTLDITKTNGVTYKTATGEVLAESVMEPAGTRKARVRGFAESKAESTAVTYSDLRASGGSESVSELIGDFKRNRLIKSKTVGSSITQADAVRRVESINSLYGSAVFTNRIEGIRLAFAEGVCTAYASMTDASVNLVYVGSHLSSKAECTGAPDTAKPCEAITTAEALFTADIVVNKIIRAESTGLSSSIGQAVSLKKVWSRSDCGAVVSNAGTRIATIDVFNECKALTETLAKLRWSAAAEPCIGESICRVSLRAGEAQKAPIKRTVIVHKNIRTVYVGTSQNEVSI